MKNNLINIIPNLFRNGKIANGETPKYEFISIVNVGLILTIVLAISCKKFVEVDAPTTSVNSENIYEKDVTAASVLTGLYTNLSASSIQSEAIFGIGYFTGLSCDELALVNGLGGIGLNAYFSNSLKSENNGLFWGDIYARIYIANAALEGLSKSSTLTPVVKKQLLGEAKFFRAFCFFYLVNLYGDVPLILTTDYNVNSVMSRTQKSIVWEQIINDLKDAQDLLSPDYLDASLLTKTQERLRPTKWAAIALLARTYLYVKDWKQAEEESSKILSNPSYRLVGLNEVFLKNNMEAIWQLQPVSIYNNTSEGVGFIYDPVRGLESTPAVLSEGLLSSFDQGDNRRNLWVKEENVDGTLYNFVDKYKNGADPQIPTSEYSTVFRLGEQYLIRAEARIQLNNVKDGIEDLNILRARAADKSALPDDRLKPLEIGVSKESALLSLEQERRHELFTEWGHRWLDLKRTNRIDMVMTAEVPKKISGGIWKSFQQLYPIPFQEMLLAPMLKQNDGY